MRKLLVIIAPAVILFSCKKNDNGSGNPGNTNSTVIKELVLHSSLETIIDTALFAYDAQGRLTQFTEGIVDSTNSSSYFTDKYAFSYSGNTSQLSEYAYSDNYGDVSVDLVTNNSSGQIVEDSTIGEGALHISYGSNLINNIYLLYYNGYPYSSSDSLFFDANSNLTQYASDSIIVNPDSSFYYSRNYAINYTGYTNSANPFNKNFNNVAGILSDFAYVYLDPALLYSKQLPSDESSGGTAITFQYYYNGTQLKRVTESDNVGDSDTIDLYY